MLIFDVLTEQSKTDPRTANKSHPYFKSDTTQNSNLFDLMELVKKIYIKTSKMTMPFRRVSSNFEDWFRVVC